MTTDKSKVIVNAEIARRGLMSCMNNTKWNELRVAVRSELPFPPPFQLKSVLREKPDGEGFDADVTYLGDWGDESMCPLFTIEWIRIRPRYLRHRGLPFAAEILSVETQLIEILDRYHIPYQHDGQSIWIYGYRSVT